MHAHRLLRRQGCGTQGWGDGAELRASSVTLSLHTESEGSLKRLHRQRGLPREHG